MAIGDEAAEAGMELVPNAGEDGRVRWGAREINRTRDYIAQVVASVLNVWPVQNGGTGSSDAGGARTNLGIRSGTTNPANSLGSDGDIYFKIV